MGQTLKNAWVISIELAVCFDTHCLAWPCTGPVMVKWWGVDIPVQMSFTRVYVRGCTYMAQLNDRLGRAVQVLQSYAISRVGTAYNGWRTRLPPSVCRA